MGTGQAPQAIGVVGKERYLAVYLLMLAKRLSAVVREQAWNDDAMRNRMMVGLRLIYPPLLSHEMPKAPGSNPGAS